ncbi:hypothetical protein OESDEN_24920 [Oesophagostomum dentatum]|uniref:Uncharacterized protein n=1 Tax=Oesophagostomum dentatum TaxID=61180 RepID=A0A0B1RQW8_OESDE|nr:hypothetical protein OESDEN_24920 [Oesophagostomum dentatum]
MKLPLQYLIQFCVHVQIHLERTLEKDEDSNLEVNSHPMTSTSRTPYMSTNRYSTTRTLLMLYFGKYRSFVEGLFQRVLKPCPK